MSFLSIDRHRAAALNPSGLSPTSRGSGQGERCTDSPSGCAQCQASSVTKGRKGAKSERMASSAILRAFLALSSPL